MRTVASLIAELQKFPPDALACGYDDHDGAGITVVTAERVPTEHGYRIAIKIRGHIAANDPRASRNSK